MLLPEVEEKLRSSGWFPDRRVDDAQVAHWLRMSVRGYGCHVFPEAVRILRQYGGLTLGEKMGGYSVRVDPLLLGRYGEPDWWLIWEWELREVLFPIASYENLSYSFAVAPNGRIFATGLTDIDCGSNFEEALANLLLPGRSTPELVEVVQTRNDSVVEEEALSVYRAIAS